MFSACPTRAPFSNISDNFCSVHSSRAMSGMEESKFTTTEKQPGFSLESILNGDPDNLPDHPAAKEAAHTSDDETHDSTPAQGFCIECEGIASAVQLNINYLIKYCICIMKINLRTCIAKHAQMNFAMCALRHSIEKARASSILQDVSCRMPFRRQEYRMVVSLLAGFPLKRQVTE